MSSLSTGRGDQGMTNDGRGRPLSKNSDLITLLGDLDALSVDIGGVRCLHPGCASQLLTIQQQLLTAMGQLAGVPEENSAGKGNSLCSGEEALRWLSEQLAHREEAGGGFTGFVMPGESAFDVAAHRARTAARRAERSLWALGSEDPAVSAWGAYLNRLSDYLFSIIHT